MKISPKRSPKSILEEGQTSRECHIKQAVPNSTGRKCHAKKIDHEDRKVARAARATTAGWARLARARPCHLCSLGTAVPPVQPWHGHDTGVLVQPDV